jgi:PAS domain S-box-containing protein
MKLQRYFSCVIGLCVAPLLLLTAGLAVMQVREIRVDNEREAMHLANKLAQAVDSILQARLGVLHTLAAMPQIEQPQRRRDLYEQALGFADVFDSDLVLDEPGPRISLHTRLPLDAPMPPDPDSSGRTAAALALSTGRPAVGDLVRGDPLAQEPTVVIAVPVLREGRAVLALSTPMPASRFDKLLAGFARPDGWTLVLRDSRGQRIAGDSGPSPGTASVERHVVQLGGAPWTVELSVSPMADSASLLEAGALLAAAVLATAAVVVVGSRHAARRVSHAVASLAQAPPEDPASAAPSAGAAGTEFAEVRVVRERLAQTSRELQSSRARLRAVFDSVADAVLSTDEQHRIVMANPAAALMLGIPPAELPGTPLGRFVPERHREEFLADTRSLSTNDSTPDVLRRSGVHGRRADGSEFRLDVSISHVKVEGQGFFTVVLRDITERERADAALRDNVKELNRVGSELERSHTALQNLIAAQGSVQEDERQRIARELHDELQQTLAAIQMDASASAALLQTQPQQAGPLLERIDRLAVEGITATRRIVNDLRPQLLEELGLLPALEALGMQFSQRSGVSCSVRAQGPLLEDGADLPPAVATCLYRVAQESLNNVSKHAGARRVKIVLRREGDGGTSLRISDDGRGMAAPAAERPARFGLQGMQERVRSLGGQVRLSDTPGGGVTVEVRLPPQSPA